MSASWQQNRDMIEDFHIAAYTAMVKERIIPGDPARGLTPWTDEQYMMIYNKWKNAETDRIAFFDPQTYLTEFMRYTRANYGKPRRQSGLITVSCEITRHYGDVSVTYGLKQDYLCFNLDTLPLAFSELRELVENRHSETAENRPALMPNKLREHDSSDTEVVHMIGVKKEFVDGKDRIRLIGGDYQEHGVAVYPEYFEALRIDPAALAMGTNEYNAWVRVQLDGKGRPKRALEIVPVTPG